MRTWTKEFNFWCKNKTNEEGVTNTYDLINVDLANTELTNEELTNTELKMQGFFFEGEDDTDLL